MFGKVLASLPLVIVLGSSPIPPPRPAEIERPPTAKEWAAQCEDWDEWDKPGPPFKIHGNTYYVGTCGIASILVTSPDGHVLIDSGTEKGVNTVHANIAKLGIWVGDVKLLLMSHEHFDHVGGMATLQERSGAALVTTAASEEVMKSGKASARDPQHGQLPDMEPVGQVYPMDSTGTAIAAGTAFNPVPTPGHSPGAMSWTWKSCEGKDCVSIVYADSLSAISTDGFRFTDHPEYVLEFRYSIYRLAELDCDILITPHPSSSDMRSRILGPGLIDRNGCMAYAKTAMKRLEDRLEREAAEKNTDQ